VVRTSLNSVVVGELTFSFVRIAEGVKIGGMANWNIGDVATLIFCGADLYRYMFPNPLLVIQ